MKVIGIDPSLTCTALCFLDRNDVVTTEVINVKGRGQDVTNRIDRCCEIARRVVDAIETYNNVEGAVVFLEGYSYHSPGKQIFLGEFGGILRSHLLNGELTNTKVIEVPPTKLKKFATGKGNADKPKIASAVMKRWNMEFNTHDETDAYCLMKMGRIVCGQEFTPIAYQHAVCQELMLEYSGSLS